MEKIKIQNLNWIDVVNPTEKDIKYLNENFHFHPIVLNELLSPTLRPKVENYDNYLYMVLHFPIYSQKEQSSKSMEIDFLITPTTLITVRYGKIHPLQEFWKKCQTDQQYLYFQNSPALLLHCILQELNNFSLRQIDHITKKVDEIEDRMFKIKGIKEETKMLEKILFIRRDILNFRRTLKPQEIILLSLKNRGMEFFSLKLEPYFNDIIGDYTRIWNLLESHKETIESLQASNDSWLSNRTNLIMKILTMFSVIVFPLTLLATLFSINAKHVPIIGIQYDFWIILGIMFVATIFMLIIFKAKKWL